MLQPNDIHTDINPVIQCDHNVFIKPFTTKEVQRAINKFNVRKAPGLDLVTPCIIKEAPRKAIVMLTYLFSAIIK